MYVPFQSLPQTSRIWVYQSSEKITPGQMPGMTELLTGFTSRWAAHGQPLRASFDVRFDRFVILAADENYNQTSGCSIDESVRGIKELEVTTGLDFFNRNLVAFKIDGQVVLLKLSELKEKFSAGILNEETPSFNNLIDTKSQLETEWLVPAGKTWLRRYVLGSTVRG